MKPGNIGDRWKNGGLIVEYTSKTEAVVLEDTAYKCVCVAIIEGDEYTLGDEEDWQVNDRGWTYLGHFGKGSQFVDLYDKLNG
jgi:hypothetical protein